MSDDALPKLSGRMPSVCMYCKDVYGQKPCVPENDGKASHGICPACFPAAVARLIPGTALKEADFL